MTNDEYTEIMTAINEVVVYELIDTRTGKRYIGQTRKDLEKTRRPQHFAEARADRAGRALHVHLQNVMDEGREDDIEIRPTDFSSEWRATQHYGVDNLLNGMPGEKGDPDGMYDWLPDELPVILEHGQDTATKILREEHDRGGPNLKNKVRDTRAQLDLEAKSGGCLTDEQVLEIWIRYHLDENASYTSVAEKMNADDEALDISSDVVARIIREETYTHIDLPSPAAIRAADAYNEALDAVRPRRQGEDAV